MHINAELFNPGKGSELYRITQDAWKWFQDGSLPAGDLFENYRADTKYPVVDDPSLPPGHYWPSGG